MALTQPILLTALNSTRVAGIFPFNGASYTQIATAVATAVSQWAVGNPVNLALEGTAIGTAGVGSVMPGKLVLPPDVDAMMKGLKTGNMNGPLALSLATAITLGLAMAVTASGQYAGVSSTVGVGGDISEAKVVNRTTLTALVTLHLVAMLGPGPAIINMATGLGNGIANLFEELTGVGPVVGVPTIPPAPSTGKSYSVVL
jgi:hypothetical protein